MEESIFICGCNNVEHQLLFRYFKNDKPQTVYMSVHLITEKNIFKRIYLAIKYIFGYKSKYGHFDEFIFKHKDKNKLQQICDFL